MRQKQRITEILQNSLNTSIINTSVIFQNNITGKLRFYNGIKMEFEPITQYVFDELLKDGVIKREKCVCQGETRYILA